MRKNEAGGRGSMVDAVRISLPYSTALALICAAGMSSPVIAQDDKASASKQIQAFRACQAITNQNDRLGCYDKAAADFLTASDRGELQVVDREAVKKTKRRLFGFALPDLNIFGGNDADEPELDMLETTIASVSRGGGSNWTFTTPEGAVWEIRNAPFSFRDPKAGDKVVFKRAALGSYFIRINDRIGVKGKRIG